MVSIVKLIGIIMVAFSSVYFFKPAVMKKVIKFWKDKRKLYWGASLSLLIGVLFLLVASFCVFPPFIYLVGGISVLKGLTLFILRPEDSKKWLDQIGKLSSGRLRIIAVVSLALGALIILSA